MFSFTNRRNHNFINTVRLQVFRVKQDYQKFHSQKMWETPEMPLPHLFFYPLSLKFSNSQLLFFVFWTFSGTFVCSCLHSKWRSGPCRETLISSFSCSMQVSLLSPFLFFFVPLSLLSHLELPPLTIRCMVTAWSTVEIESWSPWTCFR